MVHLRVGRLRPLTAGLAGLAAVLAGISPCLARGAKPAAMAAPRPTSACALEPGPLRAVAGIIDAETIKLDDGTEVRLSGALAPRPPDQALDVSFWPPAVEAKAALEQLVVGKSVELAFSGRRTDRYGRTLAHVFVDIAGERVWVQAQMLSTGHARAYVLGDGVACAAEMIAHEALARAAGLGLWRHAAYQTRAAGRTAELMRLRSTYQIVEGEIVAAVQTKALLLLHFGPDKSRDFTIALKPQQRRQLEQLGVLPTELAGRRLAVRGWIERRQGPAIEIVDVHQIEMREPEVAAIQEVYEPAERPARRSRRKAAVAPTE